MAMKQFSVYVKDAVESELVQKWLFEHGYAWYNGKQKVCAYRNNCYLFCRADGEILFGDYVADYTKEKYPLATFTTTTKTIIDTFTLPPDAPKTIEIMGKTYNLADVEECLSSLKAVED